MRPLRCLGWVFVVGLAVWAGMGGCRHRGVTFVDLPPDRIAELAALPTDRYREWLVANATLPGTSQPSQVFIIQRLPGQDPLVLCTLHGEYNEETSGWHTPWPALRAAMERLITGPTTVSGSFGGVEYYHHLVPVDSTARVYLLTNHWRRPPPWLGWRSLVVVIAAAMASWLCLLHREGS